MIDTKTYERLGLHLALGDVEPRRVVNGRANREIMQSLATPADEQYHPCPEAYVADGVPRGKVRKFQDWADSAVYPGTKRDLWLYTPARFEALTDQHLTPPAVMVFNDGGGYLAANGPVRAAAVFDTLIHAQQMPNTIGVFVMPGRALEIKSARDLGPGEVEDPRVVQQRSVEYDSCTGTYAQFLLDDVLPMVTREIGCALTTDPRWRTVCGISSGGICAFTAAWYRPESFGRVLSHCGSFTAIRGGHNYPYLIRSTPRKPIRVFMQSGERDADILFGSWPLANKEVAAALQFAGYEVNFKFGEGSHNLRHGGALFAESLRWLWAERD